MSNVRRAFARWSGTQAVSPTPRGTRRFLRRESVTRLVSCVALALVLLAAALVRVSPAAALVPTPQTTSSTATQLVFTQQPSGASGGTAFTTQPKVTFEDASNAVVSTTASVSLAVKSGTGASGATLTCPAVAAVAGVATFAGCKIDLAHTGYKLVAEVCQRRLRAVARWPR
jgi:hypothetical protein